MGAGFAVKKIKIKNGQRNNYKKLIIGKKNSNYHFVATVDKTVLFISIVEFWAHLLTLEHNSG